MIIGTPAPKKRRADSVLADRKSPVSDRRLVIYKDPAPVSAVDPPDDMVCTYHCRQMVKSDFMVAFDNAEKQGTEDQARLDILNSKLSQSEDEKEKYRDNLFSLKQELEASKGREHALQERLLKELGDSMQHYKEELKI